MGNMKDAEDAYKNRVLIAKVGCDIHERGARTLLTALRDAGMEVIYTGRYQTPKAVAEAAVQEDVDVIALSDHTGSLLTPDDVQALEDMGVKGNCGPGTPIEVVINLIDGMVERR